MTAIDQLANCSPLKDIHPAEKVFMAISTLLLVISLDSYLLSVVVLFLMSYLLLVKARVEGGFYLRMMGIPLGFLLIGCLTILCVLIYSVIYSNIFVLLQTACEIYIAQLSRSGYQGFIGSLKSLALLCSNLLLKGYSIYIR